MQTTLSRRGFVQKTAMATLAATQLPSLIAAETPLSVALVGGAHIHTPGFINLLKGRSDVNVKSVWDHDAKRAAARAQSLGGKTQVVSDVNKIWSDGEIKGVVICSETDRHRELVLAAAAARKHLFVEKPLGFTARDSWMMAGAMEKAELLFTTGYFMRTDPKHLFLKDQIAKGLFGKITRARGSNCHNGSLGGWFDTEWRWMADPKQAGVGGFGDLGTHKLDILMWLLGDVESVTGSVNVITGRYGACDESGEALLKFKSGVTATLAAGWVDIDDPVQLLISGTEAHASIVGDKLYYKNAKVAGADGKTPFTALPPASRQPLHQWLDAMGGKGSQPLVSPKEAAARVAVMEAIYKGARSRTWVKV
ncbi:MAG: Gfo/Idh/MocA family oxidoreductase [Verrucomicrobia bacterium]|nr:Gfo/Idh/MocA family oxidoreductase [Verrucomicrobiota bacterium]